MTAPHRHRGKSSERFLNKDLILKEINISPGQVILDAGCGNGYMSKEFSRLLHQSGKVYALDPDEEAIENLKKEKVSYEVIAHLDNSDEATINYFENQKVVKCVSLRQCLFGYESLYI